MCATTGGNPIRSCGTAGCLLDEYGGKLSRLQASARTSAEVEQRLLAFFGVGPVTANIFLRELRPHWPLADPEPLPVVAKMASLLAVDLGRYDRKSLTFARLEAGLIRLRHATAKGRHAQRGAASTGSGSDAAQGDR